MYGIEQTRWLEARLDMYIHWLGQRVVAHNGYIPCQRAVVPL